MESLGKFSLYLHILAGVITLVAGPIAIFGQNRLKLHRVSGRLFYYAMLVVVITSIIGFIKYPTVTFYQFLLGIALLVGYHAIRGVRSILIMKRKLVPGAIDRAMYRTLGITGIVMLSAATWHYTQGSNVAFPILFGVFGFGALNDARQAAKLFANAQQLDGRWWMKLHISSMFAAFTASTTAFAVNAADFAPWYVQWFAPTLILVPVQIYFLKQRGLTSRQLRGTKAAALV